MKQKYHVENDSRWPQTLTAFAILCIVFLFMARYRLVDVDEGYYLLAAKLVTEGKTPYLDFFYPQMPLLPYGYGLWMKLFGTSWYSARHFSALLTVALGMLVYFHLVRITGRRNIGLLGVILFMSSSFSLGWFTTVKTYALSTLLVFASYLMLASTSTALKKYFWGGFFLGLAFDARLLLVGLIPTVAVHIFWLEKNDASRLFRGGWWTVGFLGAFLVNGYFLFNLDNFFFNNVGYHLLRSDYRLADTLKLKLETALKLFGIGSTEPALSVQFVLISLVGIYFIRPPSRLSKNLVLPTLFAISLLIFSFLPNPAHTQYLVVAVPFLIVALLGAVAERWTSWSSSYQKQNRRRLKQLLTVAASVYIAGGIFDGYRYTFGGENVPGIGWSWNASNWKIETVREISGFLDTYSSQPDVPVISWWPGYFVESRTSPLPGMENNFGLAIAPKLSPDERKRYRIASQEEIETTIRKGEIELVVLDNRASTSAEFRERHRLLQENGFAIVKWIQLTPLYKRMDKF